MDQNLIIYIAIALVVIFIIFVVSINKSKKTTQGFLSFDIEHFILYLGGNENIIDYQTSLSKIKIKVKDNSLVDLDKVKNLGASGIVETSEGFTFIFGNVSSTIGEELDKKMK